MKAPCCRRLLVITVHSHHHHHRSTEELSTKRGLQLARFWTMRTISFSEKCLLESIHSWNWLETDIITVSTRSSCVQCCQVLNLDMTPSNPRSEWKNYMCCSRLFVATVYKESLWGLLVYIAVGYLWLVHFCVDIVNLEYFSVLFPFWESDSQSTIPIKWVGSFTRKCARAITPHRHLGHVCSLMIWVCHSFSSDTVCRCNLLQAFR